MCVCINVYMSACSCVCVYVCKSVFVCVCVHVLYNACMHPRMYAHDEIKAISADLIQRAAILTESIKLSC